MVDNDLSPGLATALKSSGITAVHAKYQFVNYPDASVPDEVQVEYCKQNGYIWVTGDLKAQWLAKNSRINGIWLIVGKHESLTAWEQLKIMARILDEVERQVKLAKGAIHFKAGIKSPRLKVDWTQPHTNRPP